MGFKNSKVAIVGVGNVGATTAYTIVNQGLCEEIVLIDVNKDKAYAEALDMLKLRLQRAKSSVKNTRQRNVVSARTAGQGDCSSSMGQAEPVDIPAGISSYKTSHRTTSQRWTKREHS